ASLRRDDLLLEDVGHLPAEVPARHGQQHFRRSVRIDEGVFEILAAHMHVRMQAVDVAVFFESELGRYFIVGVAWWNRKITLRRPRGDDALFDRVFREDQADAGAIGSGFAGRDVVNLEYEHRAFFDQLRLTRAQRQRGFAWRPSDQPTVRICWT